MPYPPDFGQLQVGGVLQPLSDSSPNTLLRDADPALFYFLEFCQFVIETYPGPRLVQALSQAGITFAGRQITKAVAQAYPYAPLPEQLETQFEFPLLAIYRTDAKTEWHSMGYEIDSCALDVLYVLPPMDAAGCEQILPILKPIADALRSKTTMAFDPGYAPTGGNLGDQFSSANFANVVEIGFGEDRNRSGGRTQFYSNTNLPSAGSLYFPTFKFSAYVRERDMYVPGPRKFAGADLTADLVAPDGTRVPAAVQASGQQAPTISSLSVTSGPAAGGTVVNITGSLFLSGPPQVQFGGNYAPSVTWNSATSLTVTTPAMSGAGSVGVTVTNRDSQVGFLANAFTFV